MRKIFSRKTISQNSAINVRKKYALDVLFYLYIVYQNNLNDGAFVKLNYLSTNVVCPYAFYAYYVEKEVRFNQWNVESSSMD